METILTAREIVDLDIRRSQISERVAAAGETLHLKAKIRNRSAAATRATTVEFHLAPVERPAETHWLGSAELAAMAGGKRKTVRFTAAVPVELEPGRYRLIAAVDAGKTNYDLRRDNNLKTSRKALEIR